MAPDSQICYSCRGGVIIELRNKGDDLNNCFFALASDLEHQYYFLSNQGTLAHTYSTDVVVDVHNLQKILDEID